LANACLQAGVKCVVFSSTAAVYGDLTKDAVISEKSMIAPLNPYGWSKWMSEQVLRDTSISSNLRSVCLRYFNVAGAATDGKNGQRTKNATHLIKVACEVATGKRSQMSIFGNMYPTADGTCIRDYIHVEDLAEIHVLAMNYLIQGGSTDVFNCGYGIGSSVLQVISEVKKVSGVDFKVTMEGPRAGDAAQLVANNQKIKQTFQWSPRFADLNLICKTAWQWERLQKTK